MLSEAAKSVDHLIVLIDKRLKNLFERSFEPQIKFVTSKEEVESLDYDFQISMGSLGRFYRNSEVDFSRNNVSYLKADEAKRLELINFIDKKENEKVVGVSW